MPSCLDCGLTSLSSLDVTVLSKWVFKCDAKQVPLVSQNFKVCVCVCEHSGRLEGPQAVVTLLRKRTPPPSATLKQHVLTLTATRWTTPASEPVWSSTIRTSTEAHVNTTIQQVTLTVTHTPVYFTSWSLAQMFFKFNHVNNKIYSHERPPVLAAV